MTHSIPTFANGHRAQMAPNSVKDSMQEMSDKVSWAMAQDDALSKMKLFSSMAKQMNDQ